MMMFGAYSYAAVGLFYLILCVLLVTSWRGRLMGGLLITACSINMVWGFTLAAHAAGMSVPSVVVFVFEVLRSAAWLTFLVALTRTLGLPLFAQVAASLVWILTLGAGLAVWQAPTSSGEVIGVDTVLIPGGLVMALAGLVLVEQLYRNSPADARWGVKLLSLGLGGMFAYDLFLYSQGLLFDLIEASSWAARGIVNVFLVPLIAVSAQRNPRWSLDVFVSRQVVFYTTALIAVGAYLLLMSLGGYYILLYGGSWSGLVQIVFFFGAMLVLVTLLFSSSLRGQLKVFIVKHFFRNKYDYREEWLRLVSTLSRTDGNTGESLIKALVQMVGSPGGLLWGLNDDTYQLAAKFQTDIEAPDIAETDPLVQFMKKQSWLIDLREYRDDAGLYDELYLPEWIAEVDGAWLLIPLLTGDRLNGIVLLLEPETVPKLNYEDRDLLKTAGSHLAVHLAQEVSDSLLAEARQFEAYNRLTAFLMHDLQNLIAQQSLIVKNAERHKRNPEFVDDAMETIANSVKRMNKVMEQLKRGRETGVVRKTRLKYLVSNAVDRCAGNLPQPRIDLVDPDVSVEVDPERFSMVLQHLIRNAQDATSNDGSINISVSRNGSNAEVTVADNGCGMTQDFVRDHLFKPFDSTKGSQGMGIGAHQSREFARKMGGDLRVDTAPGRGTTIVVSLPLG